MRPSLLLVLLLALPAIAAEAGKPLRVTTDSVEYCLELSERLGRLPHAVESAPRKLGEEGRRLCANGHVRTGIAKLRRAIRAAQAEPRRG